MREDRFEVIESTHLNTQYVHNHFVLYKDGYKQYSNLENTALFRKISDDICEKIEKSVLVIKNEIKELVVRENKPKELVKNKTKERKYERYNFEKYC